MVTNANGAQDFCVLAASVELEWTDPAAWTELVAHQPGRRVIGVEPFQNHLVIYEWSKGAAPAAAAVPRRIGQDSRHRQRTTRRKSVSKPRVDLDNTSFRDASR